MADILQDVRALNENDAADDKEVKGLVKMLDEKYNPQWEEARLLEEEQLLPPKFSILPQAAVQLQTPALYILDRRMTAGETWESCLDEIRALPSVKKYGDDVTVSMYSILRPSWTELVYPIECYFPTWVIPKDHKVTKHVEEAYTGLYGTERVGNTETEAIEKKPVLLQINSTFSTNRCFHYGKKTAFPCIGFGPGAEAQAHARNEKPWKIDLVRCAAVYAALPGAYCK